MANKYLSGLEWMEEFASLTDSERKVLVALSREDKRWRSKAGLMKSTQVDESEIDEILAKLLHQNVLTPSFSKAKKIIYRLSERD